MGLSQLQPESSFQCRSKTQITAGFQGPSSVGHSRVVCDTGERSSQWQQIHSQMPAALSHAVQSDGMVKLRVQQKSRQICGGCWVLLQVVGMSGLGYAVWGTPKGWPLSWCPEASHQDAFFFMSLSTQKQYLCAFPLETGFCPLASSQ